MALMDNCLELRTEVVSPKNQNVHQNKPSQTSASSQPKSEKLQFKWNILQENRLFYMNLIGASRKDQSLLIKREPMHIFSKIQKHNLLLKKINDAVEAQDYSSSQKKFLQGNSHLMKYITYLENLCSYILFELRGDTSMNEFILSQKGISRGT